MAICTTASITVTAATIALCLKHKMKHTSSRGPYLSSRKLANSVLLLSPLQILQLPPPLEWCSDMYPCFLSGSGQFFLFPLLFFVSPLISSPWRGKWWSIFRLYCCLLEAIVHSLGLSLNHIFPGMHGYCTWRGAGHCTARAQEWLTLLRHSPWLWLERWIQANQTGAIGWSYRHGRFLHSWPVSYSTIRS